MKLYGFKLFGAILAIAMLSIQYAAQATPQHHIGVRGVIQSVDDTNRSLTVLDQRKGAETFVWNSNTWFRQKTPKPCARWFFRLFSYGAKTNAESLQPGRTIMIYWRSEHGRPVARETVVWLPTPACSCPARR